MIETLTIDNCICYVDKEATANFISESNAPCDCSYCRNYFKAIQDATVVQNFLNLFGINVERPEECMYLESDYKTNTMHYIVWYAVTGAIEKNSKIILAKDIEAEISIPSHFDPNTDHDDKYFWVCIDLSLPWLLDEDINQFIYDLPKKFTLTEFINNLFNRKDH